MNTDDLIERTQWDTFWVPSGVSVIDRPELLLLSCPEAVHGLNAVHRLRSTDADLPRLLDEVTAHHVGRSSRIQLYPSNIRPAMDRALSSAGYTLTNHHDAHTLSTDARRAPTAAGLVVRPVDRLDRLVDAITVTHSA